MVGPIIQLCVAGMGYGRAVHLPVFSNFSDVDVVAVMARRIEKAEAAAREFRIPNYCDNFEEIFRLAPDAISIALPPDVAAELALQAVERGVAVLIEKPIAASLAQARVLAQASTGRVSAINLSFAELDAFRMLASRVRARALGDVRLVTVSWLVQAYHHRRGQWSWKSDRDRFGGILSSHAAHIVYLLEWMTGPITSVQAITDNRASSLLASPGSNAAPDALVLNVCFEGGALGQVMLSNACLGGRMHRWNIISDRGAYVMDWHGVEPLSGFRLQEVLADGSSHTLINPTREPEGAPDARQVSFERIARRFVEAVKGGGSTWPDIGVGLRIQIILDSIEKSAATGHRIPVEAAGSTLLNEIPI